MTMPEPSSEKVDHVVTLQIKLKPVDRSDQPLSANYTIVGVAQGVAYLDFGFIEPALLEAVTQRLQRGEALPRNLDGTMAARVALPLEGLLRLQRQLQQVLAGLRGKQATKS